MCNTHKAAYMNIKGFLLETKAFMPKAREILFMSTNELHEHLSVLKHTQVLSDANINLQMHPHGMVRVHLRRSRTVVWHPCSDQFEDWTLAQS